MVNTHRGKIIILIFSNKKSAFCWGKKFSLPNCKNKFFFFLHEGPLEVLGKASIQMFLSQILLSLPVCSKSLSN